MIVHPGAGVHIVGEETALIESLEGKRGFPRIKPPGYPAVRGLYSQPTIVNNVETLATLPWIVNHGGQAYAALGGGRSRGTRLFSLSGSVRRPGVYEVELYHTRYRDLLFDPALGGGMARGELRAFIPGASFPWFFPEQPDLRLDADEVAAGGSQLTAGIMVLDDGCCPVRAWRLVRFFHRESCGQCTPCREGPPGWAASCGGSSTEPAAPQDLRAAPGRGGQHLPRSLPSRRCGRGGHAVPLPPDHHLPPGPLRGLAYRLVDPAVRDDYLRHIKDGGCPYPAST